MHKNPNIVQVEFFRVNVRANSLESLMADIHSRNADGADLKITLRFFDSLGEVTSMALKLQRLEKWRERLEICIAAKTGWRQEFANSLHHTVLKWIRQVKEGCARCAADQLRFAIETRDKIAIEQSDHSFRLLQGNETYETLTAVEKSKGAWVFIFKPNDLIAERNESIAHVI